MNITKRDPIPMVKMANDQEKEFSEPPEISKIYPTMGPEIAPNPKPERV